MLLEITPILACEPTTIAMAVMSIASAAVQYAGAKQQAAATEKHQNLVGENMREQHALQVTHLSTDQRDKLDAAARVREQYLKKSMQVAGRARAAGGEAGIAGDSLQLAYQEFDRHDAEFLEASYMKTELGIAKFDRDLDYLNLSTTSRLVSNYSPINQPAGAAYALKGAMGAVGAYDNYLTRNPKLKTPDPIGAEMRASGMVEGLG